jgi:hypothetical protein
MEAPIYSFGNRLEANIRNKEHLKPKKVDGPGPGAYKLPSSVKVVRRHPASVNRTTFGTAGRDFVNPKETPAPNRYRPV